MLASGASGYLLKEDGVDEAARPSSAAATGTIVLTRSAATLLGQATSERALAHVRELEEQIRDMETQMADGTSAKAQFLANISHELRTPVTVAKGIAYVLKNPSVSDEERVEFLGQLQSSLDRLAGLVDEIIAIAELEQGTFELHIEYTDLAPLIDKAVADMGQAHPSILVVSRIPGNLFALADEARIHGVIHELLENACRYSPDDRSVEVRARVMDQGIVISVTDQGSGLGRDVAWRSLRTAVLDRRGHAPQGEGRRGRRAPSGAPARDPPRRHPVDRPGARRRHPRLVLPPLEGGRVVRRPSRRRLIRSPHSG